MGEASDQIREYRVEGMSCSNCERHVREAVERLDGVALAEADAGAARLRVHGPGIHDDAVAAAVEGAGYEMAP